MTISVYYGLSNGHQITVTALNYNKPHYGQAKQLRLFAAPQAVCIIGLFLDSLFIYSLQPHKSTVFRSLCVFLCHSVIVECSRDTERVRI